MKENAAQGFWNGATPPLGYRLCEAEQRGAKLKKKLQIDPVEAEQVQLMFGLYADGDPASNTAPLGIKSLCSWLNRSGYRTKTGFNKKAALPTQSASVERSSRTPCRA